MPIASVSRNCPLERTSSPLFETFEQAGSTGLTSAANVGVERLYVSTGS
jgi:hypothetical protein